MTLRRKIFLTTDFYLATPSTSLRMVSNVEPKNAQKAQEL